MHAEYKCSYIIQYAIICCEIYRVVELYNILCCNTYAELYSVTIRHNIIYYNIKYCDTYRVV